MTHQKAQERHAAVCEWLRGEIAKIEADERFHYEPATVQVNAPLALIQVEMKARYRALSDALAQLEGEQ